jgi:hypothetical protein
VRDILAPAVAGPDSVERHLGSRIAARFRALRIDLDVRELRGSGACPARLSR